MTTHSTVLPVAVLDETGLAVRAGWLTVYSADPVTGEYQSAASEFLLVGVGLPAYGYPDAPPEIKTGFALVRNIDGTTWERVPDLRGQTVYRTDTGQPVAVTTIGALASGLTRLAPASQYDKWDGENWVTDSAAQQAAAVTEAEARKRTLLQTTAEAIVLLQDAVDLGMATEEEMALLTAWKRYRVLLSRVDTSASSSIWPPVPGG